MKWICDWHGLKMIFKTDSNCFFYTEILRRFYGVYLSMNRYTQYRNIRNGGIFPVLVLKFPVFSVSKYSGFLALQGSFLNFSRFSPWFLKFSKKKSFSLHLLMHISNTTKYSWLFGIMVLGHCSNQLYETFLGRKNSNGYFFSVS